MTPHLVEPAALREAAAPAEERGLARDDVRLLVTDRAERTHAHARFCDLPSLLRAGDLLVVNDSKTLPAALRAVRADGESIALHVATRIDARLWIAEPRGPVLCGEELRLPGGASAVAIAPVEPERPRLWYTWFDLPVSMHAYLARYGESIRYGYVRERFPLAAYQTIFAREEGSSEMPSAARAFTPRVLDGLARRGVDVATITLHCSVASLEMPERPVLERYSVSGRAANAVNRARREHRRVIAVGTTVVRALESSVAGDEVAASSGWTDLVIDPEHRIVTVDGLLSGFHDASATHQWMLDAFLDRDLLGEAYARAASQGYYRHEFGDLHLIV